MLLGDRDASAPVATSSHKPWRVLKPEPLANPLLGKWLCVLKDARPCRIFQCRCLSNLVRANSHSRSLSLTVDPSGELFLPESHSRRCAFVLPMFASGSLLAPPLEDYGVHAGVCKRLKVAPRRAIRDWLLRGPTSRMALRMKDPSLPQARPFTTNVFRFLLLLIAFLK